MTFTQACKNRHTGSMLAVPINRGSAVGGNRRKRRDFSNPSGFNILAVSTSVSIFYQPKPSHDNAKPNGSNILRNQFEKNVGYTSAAARPRIRCNPFIYNTLPINTLVPIFYDPSRGQCSAKCFERNILRDKSEKKIGPRKDRYGNRQECGFRSRKPSL